MHGRPETNIETRLRMEEGAGQDFETGMPSTRDFWTRTLTKIVVVLSFFALIALAAKPQPAKAEGAGMHFGLVCLEKQYLMEIVSGFRLDPHFDWQGLVDLMSSGSPYPVCGVIELSYNNIELRETLQVRNETFQLVSLVVYRYEPGNWSNPGIYVYYALSKLNEQASSK